MDIKDLVEEKLNNYKEDKSKLKLLKLDIEHFSGISYDDAIESLSLPHPSIDHIKSTLVSDRTSTCGLSYREMADKMNDEALREMIMEYADLKYELDILEFCLDSLDEKISKVLKGLYLNKKTWMDICGEYDISQTMVGKYRKKGITELIKMYSMRHSSVF